MRGGYALSYLPTFDHGFNNGFSLRHALVASVDGGHHAGQSSEQSVSGGHRPAGRQLAGARDAGRTRVHATRNSGPHDSATCTSSRLARSGELPGRMVVDVVLCRQPHARPGGVEGHQRDHGRRSSRIGNAMLVPVPNPFQGLLPGTPFNGATVPRQQLVRPYPQFATSPRIGAASARRLRLASGEPEQAHGEGAAVPRQLYLLATAMEEVTYLNPQDDWNNLTRVVTATDAPHRLLFSTTYQLPFFADQQGVMGSLLGGWQMNAIVVAQSGTPGRDHGGRRARRRPGAREPDAGALVQHLHARRSPAAVRTARRRTNPPPGASRRRSRFGTSRRASRTYGRTGRR